MQEDKPRFRLTDDFKEEYRSRQPDWGALAEVTYLRTYARTKPDGTLETWAETCERVIEGMFTTQLRHCKQLNIPWNYNKAQKTAQEAYKRLFDRKWTPPGRGLWVMGTEVVEKKGGAPLNNCAFVTTEDITTDFAEPFCWQMDMSMLGVGVGFDDKGAGTMTVREPRQGEDTYVVEDTREGWIDLIRTLLNAYAGKGHIPKYVDYTKIRKQGEPLKTFGGVSSGYGPLAEAYENIKSLLDSKVGEKISSETIVDIMNLLGRCVVSGGIRRTAQIAFGNPDDELFLKLKDPETNGESLTHHRWASNNSVFAEVGMDYSKVAELTAKNGEPGYEWLSNAQAYSRMDGKPDYKDRRARGGNPCLEQTLEPFELCCLVETYPSRHEDLDDWIQTLKFAYLYAKSVTLIPTHDARTNAVMLRNRRIGCSMSGIVQAFDKFGRRKLLTKASEGYEAVAEWDEIYSDWLCIPRSIKTTSVKPSGTVSLLAEVTPGIHYPQSKYYIRNVRVHESSPLLPALKKAGYSIEDDKYAPQTKVVSFPVKLEHVKRTVGEVSMWEQLENAAQIQRYWADNQVSVTVNFKPEEAGDIKYALELYETRLKGVSFLPLTDHGYEQAPYVPISEQDYSKMTKKLKKLEVSNAVHEADDKFCDGETCTI